MVFKNTLFCDHAYTDSLLSTKATFVHDLVIVQDTLWFLLWVVHQDPPSPTAIITMLINNATNTENRTKKTV